MAAMGLHLLLLLLLLLTIIIIRRVTTDGTFPPFLILFAFISAVRFCRLQSVLLCVSHAAPLFKPTELTGRRGTVLYVYPPCINLSASAFKYLFVR